MMLDKRVYIVDDEEAIRDSLSVQLGSAGFDVHAFSSGGDFLEAAPRLGPGCLLSDLRMPELDGLALLSRLTELRLPCPVVLMTGHGEIALAVQAMKAGAVDFIEKPFDESTVLDSIQLAHQRLAKTVANEEVEAAITRLAQLTYREREVLDALVEGLPNKTIAFNLGISPRTVEVHRARVMEKLQVRNLSQLVRLVLTVQATAKVEH